ncbi:MDR family oxidoreductase [Pararobbsia silviterrae]|uniref:Oxidoreductase n=1 Tax=Pararobbsia silviterrae TaxID=1792498 RepID=A0A494XF00_9BURK|nr:MDR family oxidoreductase [Pararobbsia silviterrae]RKP46674.1 oxidoreductase [Pararobbsia silviterrae]
MFKAILLNKTDTGTSAHIESLDEAALPEGDVTVEVDYSTLNYKDGLAITGAGPVVRQFPMVPGVDFAGRVRKSASPRFKAGDAVVLNGWGVGELHWGGLAELARVRSEWLMPLPAGMNAAQAMAIGTAGYTAMLCVQTLERHGVRPGDGEIIVTGANGGVGSIAIMILAQRGYQVVASTGRPAERERLLSLGAHEVIDRATLSGPGKPLAKERWAGAVDSVGSHTLANVCASARRGGVVTACGLAQGMDFPATVAPFILRGVTLAGVDSVYEPMDTRLSAWDALAEPALLARLAGNTREIGLTEAIDVARGLLAGQIAGRVRVDVRR